MTVRCIHSLFATHTRAIISPRLVCINLPSRKKDSGRDPWCESDWGAKINLRTHTHIHPHELKTRTHAHTHTYHRQIVQDGGVIPFVGGSFVRTEL